MPVRSLQNIRILLVRPKDKVEDSTKQTVYTKFSVRAVRTRISAKQGEHLEQDSNNTRKRSKSSQPDDLPRSRRECRRR